MMNSGSNTATISTSSSKSSHIVKDSKTDDDDFVLLEFFIVNVELFSSIFNLAIKYYPDSLKKYVISVTYATYITLTILNIMLICSAVYKIKKAYNEQKDKEVNSLTKSISNKTISAEFITVLSTVMWIIVGITSILMLMHKHERFENLNLILGIIAPALGCISALVRYSRGKDEELQRKRSDQEGSSKLYSYQFIAVFEFVHCICHIIEAVQLEGATQNIYAFNNIPVIAIQCFISIALIVDLIYENKEKICSVFEPSNSLQNAQQESYGSSSSHLCCN